MIFAQEQLVACFDKNIFIGCALANSCCFKGQKKMALVRTFFIYKNFYKQNTTAMCLIMPINTE